MADLSITVAVAANVGGKSFAWTRTGTIADIDSVVTANLDGYAVGSGANTLARESTSIGGSDTPITETGAAVAAWVGTARTGAVTVYVIDPSAAAYFFAHMPMGLPFILYNGENWDGSFNDSTTATDTPTYSIASMSITALSGLCKAQGFAARKPIS
jgi:hypothetical protein